MDRTFTTPNPIELYVETDSGTLELTASPVTETTVEIHGPRADEYVVEQRDDQIRVIGPRDSAGFLNFGRHGHEVRITAPERSSLALKTGSADTEIEGPLTNLWINTGSGDVTAEVIEGETDIQSGSGDITLDKTHGAGRIKSGSGDVRIERCAEMTVSTGSGDVVIEATDGHLAVKTGSGDVHVGSIADDLTVSTGSGDLSVDVASRGGVVFKGASGDMSIGVPAGTPVWTDITTVSGDVHSNLEPVGAPADGQDYLEIRATTASGDVTLQQR